MSVNPERAQAMNLSEPYMNNDMVFTVSSSSGIKELSDLEGKKIAVQNGSTAQTILQESEVGKSCEIVALDTNIAALQQLDANLVDAVFLDSVVINYEITSTGKDYTVLDEGLSSEAS